MRAVTIGDVGLLHPDIIRHNNNVSEISARIAEELNLNTLEISIIRCAAIYHDIGKGLINQNILYKREKLTAEEFEIIKKHAIVGANFVKKNKHLKQFSKLILLHHENYDGTGYFGVAGESIPLASRVIRSADYLDALCQDRPYRAALSIQQALQILLENRQVFDQKVLEALFRTVDKNKLNIIYDK